MNLELGIKRRLLGRAGVIECDGGLFDSWSSFTYLLVNARERTDTSVSCWPHHSSLWCCSSRSSSCQPELSHCASLSTQHVRLSGVRLRRLRRQSGTMPD